MKIEARLFDKIWTIERIPRVQDNRLGICYHEQQRIVYASKLKGRELLDTIIHEMLHALFPDEVEVRVDAMATDMMGILREAGFRHVNEMKAKERKRKKLQQAKKRKR